MYFYPFCSNCLNMNLTINKDLKSGLLKLDDKYFIGRQWIKTEMHETQQQQQKILNRSKENGSISTFLIC